MSNPSATEVVLSGADGDASREVPETADRHSEFVEAIFVSMKSLGLG